jgi:glutamine cyclotransferase
MIIMPFCKYNVDEHVWALLFSYFPHGHTLAHFYRQGLTYADGTLWESNGLYGKSSVRILDPDTGKVLKSVQIPREVFGEGMTYWDGKLYQITWKAQRGFIYNSTTLDLIREFTFQTTRNEGWGITWDPCGQEFVVTDGSANLHFWDKDTLTEKRKVPVKRIDGRDARNLNEIEWFRGKILANVWYEDVLLVIDPVTGAVDKEYGTLKRHLALLFCRNYIVAVYSISLSAIIPFRFQHHFSKARKNHA